MYPTAGAWILKVQSSGMMKEPAPRFKKRAARGLTQAERVAAHDTKLEQVAATLAAAKAHRTYINLKTVNPGQCMGTYYPIIAHASLTTNITEHFSGLARLTTVHSR